MDFLDLPPEIRIQILHLLLSHCTIKVEPELRDSPLPSHDLEWTMKRPSCDIHPAVLRTCKRLSAEGHSLLYTHNAFDCSQREGTTLLLAAIGPASFSKIRHLILEWDQLQDLAWSVAKAADPDRDASPVLYGALESVTTATWRTRILGGRSHIWQQNKTYERQLCHAAMNVLENSAKLRLLVQKPYLRGTLNSVHSNNNYRVKWRLLSVEQAVHLDETVVDLEQELEMLKVKNGETAEEPVSQMDPF